MDRVDTHGTAVLTDRGTGAAVGTGALGGTGVEVVPPTRRISWGAVFAGVVLGLAVNLLLNLLGIGIGLTTIDPAQADGSPAAGSLGIGAAIWWVLAMLASTFLGGYTAAHLAGTRQRGDGILHGLVAWAFLLLLTFYLVTSAVGGLVGGAFSTLAGSVQGASGAVQQAAEGSDIGAGQITRQADSLVARVAPDATPDQVAQARREIIALAPDFLRGGQQADEARRQATEILAGIAGVPAEQIRDEVDEALQTAETEARQAAEATTDAASSAAIWGFIALALGAAAAAAGGAAGTRRSITGRPTP
ncbi:hypothetical protein [Rhodocista pekingensis]|uniref:PhnA-like protein n=1 Tax=Rhodocista pekingensis TaxID=201185 RepID=A0ABW2KV32_9PROT